MIFSSPTAPAPAATNDDAATTTSTTMNSSGSTARSNNSCVGAGDVDADKEEMVPPRLAPMLVSFSTFTISTSGASAFCPEAGEGANEEGEEKTHNIVIKGHEQEEEQAEHNHQDAGHHHAIPLCSYQDSSPLVMNSFPIQQQQSYSTALALPLGIQIVPQPVEALKDEEDGTDNIPNDNCVNLPPGASDEFYFPNTLHLAALPSGSTPAEENTATQDDVITSRHQDTQEMHCWKFNITSCRNAIVTILTIAFFIMIIVMISPYIFVFLLIFACLFSVILL